MSVVTDVILVISLSEEGPEDVFPPVDEINRWLLENGQHAGLTHLNGQEGGHKAWQSDVFGGALNHLDIKGFSQAVAGAKWVAPDRVQLLIKGEEDEVWGLVNIVAPFWSDTARSTQNLIGGVAFCFIAKLAHDKEVATDKE